jgi:anti-sigma regulatory factor (Ser/Thr protein kinase)
VRVLGLWGVDEDLTWTVELLVAELATNVVRHARTPYTIILSWDEQVFRGEVNDANQLEPRPQLNVSTDAVGGRGLLLVSKIATAWGVDMHDHGKTVWFTIAQLDAA